MRRRQSEVIKDEGLEGERMRRRSGFNQVIAHRMSDRRQGSGENHISTIVVRQQGQEKEE